MTSDHYLFFFTVFVASGLFLWLLGTASFHRRLETGSIYRAPWLGYALLVCVLQFSHLFFPIDRSVSIALVGGLAAFGIFSPSCRQSLERMDRHSRDDGVGLGGSIARTLVFYFPSRPEWMHEVDVSYRSRCLLLKAHPLDADVSYRSRPGKLAGTACV
jgi:hypothetical protein